MCGWVQLQGYVQQGRIDTKMNTSADMEKKVKTIGHEGIKLNSSIIIQVMLIKISSAPLEKLTQTHWMQCLNPRFPVLAADLSWSERR